jgi:hypothetical protein
MINIGMNNANLDQSLADLSKIIKDLAESAQKPVAQEITHFVEFKAKDGKTNTGKGLIWSGEGYTKQFIYRSNPQAFFSSESIDIDKNKDFSVGGISVLSQTELGPSVTKSSLQQVGRLKGLIVDGSININQYLIYNGTTDRLGLGTDAPNAALSVAENSIEVMIGTTDDLHGMVGTHSATDLDLVTDNTPRISIKGNGDITLGNFNRNPIKVSINGKLSVGVKVPDANVDLHVAGPARINNRLQIVLDSAPKEGTYGVGDIVWNSNPRVGVGIGWVCVRAGSPGSWYPFGEIKERG